MHYPHSIDFFELNVIGTKYQVTLSVFYIGINPKNMMLFQCGRQTVLSLTEIFMKYVKNNRNGQPDIGKQKIKSPCQSWICKGKDIVLKYQKKQILSAEKWGQAPSGAAKKPWPEFCGPVPGR